MGLVGWYRKAIPHFAQRLLVFTNLTKASEPNEVLWFKEHDSSVCSHSVFHSADFDKLFTLQADASGVGLGTVLFQEVGRDVKLCSSVLS